MYLFTWDKIVNANGDTIWRCQTKQTTVELWPRPAYCDRGRWLAHIDCPGYPINPSTFDGHDGHDGHDGFPRYYFSLERAKAEMEDLFRSRHYEPGKRNHPGTVKRNNVA